jgi:hypothetical protein
MTEHPDYTFTKADWSLIPDYMIGGLRRWIENGIEPGDFLCAVLKNDLKEACARADDNNQRRLFQYIKFLYCYAPSGCFGSEEKFDHWKHAYPVSTCRR